MSRFLVLLLLFLTLPVIADEPEEEKPKVSETMVVTATRSERAVSDLPVSVTVVEQKDIEAAPARSVDDLLRTIPGVHLPLSGSSTTVNVQNAFSMHGLGGVRALVMVDGIPLHDAYDNTISWQKVPLDSLRQIEVVRGASASLFGNSALGGTINLLTRPVEKSAVSLETAYGSFDSRRAALSLDYVLSRALAVRLSQDYVDTDGYVRVPNPGLIDVASPSTREMTSVRADYAPSDRTIGFLRASRSDLRLTWGSVLSISDREFIDVAAGIQQTLTERSLLSARVFLTDGDESWTTAAVIGPLREAEFLATDSLIPSRSAGASVDWSMQLDGPFAFISGGFDFREVEAGETRKTFDRTGAHTRTNLVNGRQRFAGLFAQTSWQPMDRLEVLASARVDYFKNLDGSDTIVGAAPTTYPDVTRTEFDPRVSFRYAGGSRFAIRGAAYRGFRAPTLRDLYRNTQIGTTTALANPDLKPETLTGAEIGCEWAFANAHLEVNVYRSDIEGFQVRVTPTGQPPNVVQFQNVGAVRSQGIEAMFDARISRRWSVNAGYTYADSTIVEAPTAAIIGKRLPDVVPHIGTLALRYRGDDGLSIDLRGRVLGRSYGEVMNVVAAPAHRVVDVAISRPIRPWIDAFAVAENVLGESYFYVLSPTSFRIGAPRSITGGLRLRFPLGGTSD